MADARWWRLARCAQVPDQFFGEGRKRAKEICSKCPVKDPCLAEGLTQDFGIWGGLDAGERRRLRLSLDSQALDFRPTPLPTLRSITVAPSIGLMPREVSGIQLGPMATADVLRLSSGEVKNADTISYRTGRAKDGGLFSEDIFGPMNSIRCACGQLNGLAHQGRMCSSCKTWVGNNQNRSERFGHILLATPVAHPLFLWSNPSVLALLIGFEPKVTRAIAFGYLNVVIRAGPVSWKDAAGAALDAVRNRRQELQEDLGRLVTEWDEGLIGEDTLQAGRDVVLWENAQLKRVLRDAESGLKRKLALVGSPAPGDLISDDELSLLEAVGVSLEVATAGEALEILLLGLDLENEAKTLRRGVLSGTLSSTLFRAQRIRILETFIERGGVPEGLTLRALPVAPPTLRPIIWTAGRPIASELNRLYQRVIHTNKRLERVIHRAPSHLLDRFGRGMLQMAVDALFYKQHPTAGRERKWTLTDSLRRDFLASRKGKRVDFSAQATVVPDQDVHIGGCILPFTLATELFEPFLARLTKSSAQRARAVPQAVEGREVIVSRVPPLAQSQVQGVSVQGLTEGRSVRLHPLTMTGLSLRAGEPVQLFVPLSEGAKRESTELMGSDDGAFWSGAARAFESKREYESSFERVSHVGKIQHGRLQRFPTADDLLNAWEQGRIGLNDPALVGTLVRLRSCVGRGLIASSIGKTDLEDLNHDLSSADLLRHLRELERAQGRSATTRALEQLARLAEVFSREHSPDARAPFSPLDFWRDAQVTRRKKANGSLAISQILSLYRLLIEAVGGLTIWEKDCHTPELLRVGWEIGRAPDGLIGKLCRSRRLPRLEMIGRPHLDAWQEAGVTEVLIRSVIGCRSRAGVCLACYGEPIDLGRPAEEGEPVGIDVAQGLLGGLLQEILVSGMDDQDSAYFDVVSDIAHARSPEKSCALAPLAGTVTITRQETGGWMVTVSNRKARGTVSISEKASLVVEPGQSVDEGDPLSAGEINPHELARIAGRTRAAEHLLSRLARQIRNRTVAIQHGEILIRLLLAKARVVRPGAAPVAPGQYVDYGELRDLERRGTPVDEVDVAIRSALEVARGTGSWLAAAARGMVPAALVDGVLSGHVGGFDDLRTSQLLGKGGRASA